MLDGLSPEKKNELLHVLRDISKECNLGAIAVVRQEGQELAFFAEKGTDQVVMSALASALNSIGQQTVKQIKCGNLDQVIIKGTEGFVILQNLDTYIVLAASREIYSLALAMNVLSKYGKNVYKILIS
ncbi:MAG: roadblock/LC7 domain-containing protein [Candidatus Heimdallarchaeota archaeon]|nr:roadblock/LC7 domain-containing protein [Candidatus Heimdallarchaeota archaeon]MCK4954442.1 roadblock/LC7 domain-containing protein [Candidatus Heimdallarchaeota archaeon]